MTRRRNHQRRMPRKGAPRRVAVLIVCEGEKTEPKYFHHFRRALREVAAIEIPPNELGTDPKSVVKWAKQCNRDSHHEYDETWCVFDRDEHAYFREAMIQARDNGYQVAFSNPCFELWFLLHFQEQTAHVDRGAATSGLKKHVKGYHKAMDVFLQLLSKQAPAIRRAKALRERHRSNGDAETENPSTSVDRLVVFLNSIAAEKE